MAIDESDQPTQDPEALPASDRVRVRRSAARGRYERDAINRILDEGLICHLGFVHDGRPMVIPTIHARDGDSIYLHGAPAARWLRGARGQGQPVCLTVTLVDGLVLARSHFHHSINYRSVVVLGQAVTIVDLERKREAGRILVEHILPGRSEHSRPPSPKEIRATAFLELDLAEASAKIRTGPPVDDEEDYSLPYWAGVLPLRQQALTPLPDPRLAPGIAIPAHISDSALRHRG